MKHLDQASLAPLGTEEPTRLSLVKTSQTLGAPSASGRVASETPPCWEEKERKQEGHTSQVLNPSPRSQSSECHQGAAPRGEHRCGSAWSRRWPTRERGEHGRDRRGPDRRAWRGNEKEEDTKTDLNQRERKPEEENGCDEGQCGPGWKGGEQQNQAGRRNRNGKNGQRETAGRGSTET